MLRQKVNPQSSHQKVLGFTAVSATARLGFIAVSRILALSTAQRRLILAHKAEHGHQMPYGLHTGKGGAHIAELLKLPFAFLYIILRKNQFILGTGRG